MGLLDSAKPVEETDEWIKLLLVGPPGGGKTRFAGGAPEPIWFDFERSSETLRHVPSLSEIPVIRPEEEWGEEGWPKLVQAVRELPDSKYNTVVFDTVRGLQDYQLRHHMMGMERKDKRSRYVPTWPDYRISTGILEELLKELQRMPVNVVYISHEVTKKDDLEGSIETRNNLTPMAAEVLNRLVSVIGYLDVNSDLRGNITRKLLIGPGQRAVAKNRLDLENVIEDPTWDKVFKKKDVKTNV